MISERMQKYLSISFILFLVLGIFVYFTPDENNYLTKNIPDSSTNFGRSYAFALFKGNSVEQINASIDEASEIKSRSNNSDFLFTTAENDRREQLQSKGGLNIDDRSTFNWSYFNMCSPLMGDIDLNDFELVSWDKLESFIVMTFAYRNKTSGFLEIPGKGKMLFTIVIRYNEPQDINFWHMTFRKIVNLLAIMSPSKYGTQGKWVTINAKINFNLRDYYEWVLREGFAYAQQQNHVLQQEAFQASNNDDITKLIESSHQAARLNIEVLQKWGLATGEYQFRRIEKSLWEYEEGGSNNHLINRITITK